MIRGVWQCKRVVFRVCPHGGSSAGMRKFLDTALPQIKEKYTHIDIETEKKGAHHPLVTAHYANGKTKPVCVRSATEDEILSVFHDLRQQTGTKYVRLHSVRSASPSVQGEYEEGTFR